MHIKELVIRVEEDNGREMEYVIPGLDIISIDQRISLVEDHFLGQSNFIHSVGPMEITLKLIAWGAAWAGAKSKRQSPTYLSSAPRKLTSKQKQLPAHEDERKS